MILACLRWFQLPLTPHFYLNPHVLLRLLLLPRESRLHHPLPPDSNALYLLQWAHATGGVKMAFGACALLDLAPLILM